MEINFELLKEELKRTNEFFKTFDGNVEEDNSVDESIEFLKTIINKEIPEDISPKVSQSFNAFLLREHAIRHMGYALVTKRFARDLAKYIGDNKCLEIMAGRGCLSKALKDEGVDIITTDDYSWSNKFNMHDTWTDVEEIHCLDAIMKYGEDVSYIICSWIPYNNIIGYEALRLMSEINPNCKMIVIGEGEGGCTADDRFFENLEEIDIQEDFMYSLRRWNGIHDYVSVVKFKDNNQNKNKNHL